MHRKLLLLGFEKVREELLEESGVKPSINKCANRLSQIISEDFLYGSKSLRTLKKRAEEDKKIEFHIPQPEVVLALAKYLEYNSYEEFVLKNKDKVQEITDSEDDLLISPTGGTAQEGDKKVIVSKRNNNSKIIMALASICFLAIVISAYIFIDRQKWMVWNGDSYEIKSFESGLEKKGILNIYDENSYQYLKKITPTCATQFFNGDGSVRIWYGKNKDGLLQYFTSYGLHPETGKTLKPITKYMIGKYICAESDN